MFGTFLHHSLRGPVGCRRELGFLLLDCWTSLASMRSIDSAGRLLLQPVTSFAAAVAVRQCFRCSQ